MKTRAALLAAAWCLTAAPASIAQSTTEKFTIKGRYIGEPVASACATGPGAVDPIGEYIAKHGDRIPGLRPTGSKNCDVPVDSFAGIVPVGPMRVLIVDDLVVQVILDLGTVTAKRGMDVIDALRASYGTPRRTTNKHGAISETWTAGSTKLELGWTSGTRQSMTMEVVLRDAAAVAKFHKTMDHNTALIENYARRSKQADTR